MACLDASRSFCGSLSGDGVIEKGAINIELPISVSTDELRSVKAGETGNSREVNTVSIADEVNSRDTRSTDPLEDAADAVGEALGDAIGEAIGEALGDALGDAIGEAIGGAMGRGATVGLRTGRARFRESIT